MKRAHKDPILFAIVAIGVALSIGLSAFVHRNGEAEAADWLGERAEIIALATEQTVASTFADLRAVAAFMATAESISQDMFSKFVESMDMNPGVVGIGYLNVVDDSDIDAFLAAAREDVPTLELISFDGLGGTAPNYEPRGTYYPLRYVHGGPFLDLVIAETPITSQLDALGFDLATEPLWFPAFEKALATPIPSVSDLLDLGGVFEEQAFGAAHPVLDESGAVEGVLVAPGLEILLTADLGVSLTSNVMWEVDNATDDDAATDWPVWRRELDLPGSIWILSVEPTEAALRNLSSQAYWWVLAIGIALTAAAATTTYQMRLRQQEHTKVEQLRQLGMDKDRFLATVSHELRTPLTVVIGLAAELNDSGDLNKAELAELLGLIEIHGLEASAIVEDLLVAARSDIDRIAVRPENIDLANAAQLAVDASPFNEIRVVGDSPDGYADSTRLQQILRNLLTNADRYGGPEVEIRLDSTATHVSVTVADSGEPISATHQRAIFDPYTSAHEGSNQIGSIGLGLFISQKLARLMDGDLSYRHNGTHVLFELTLPRADRMTTAHI
ncbi:MAG: hypothetical protein GY722_01995 [bacterium]|nr:hypothetical protein [bacterium]